MTYREELIQVAAVAVAMIEVEDRLSADLDGTMGILEEVYQERVAQNLKWGAQGHNQSTWMLILMEEVGETAEEILRETKSGHWLLWKIKRIGHTAKDYLETMFKVEP